MGTTPFDLSQLQQPDVQAGSAPGGDQSQLLLNLLRQSGGKTVDQQSPLPPQNDPSSDLRAYLQQQAMKTEHDALLEKLHMTQGEKDKRGKWGNFGQVVGNVAQSALLGRNFTNEAQHEYAAQTQRMNQGNDVVRNEDLAKQAKAQMDLNATLKGRALDQGDERLAETQRKNEATEALKQQGVNIAKMAADGKLSRYDVQNWLDSVKAKNLQGTEGLAGMYGWAEKYAKATPEEQAVMAKSLATGESLKLFGKLIRTGSDSSSSQTLDAAGNPVTSRASNTHYGGAGGNVLQQMLGQPSQNPLAQFGTPGFAGGGAASVAGGQTPPASPNMAPGHPVMDRLKNSVQPPSTPLPPPPEEDGQISGDFDPTKFLNPKTALSQAGGNKKTLDSLIGLQQGAAKVAQTKYEAKRDAIATNSMQRSALASAMIAGKAGDFQGFLPKLTEGIRNTVTDITPAEGLQRSLDFRSMYDNLGSNMKGAFKKVELDQAGNIQGTGKMTAQTALILHAVNELTQESQQATAAKVFTGRNGKPLVSPEELSKLAADEVTRYVGEVNKLKDANSNPIARMLGKTPPAPQMKSLVELVNDLRTKKKIGVAPKAAPVAALADRLSKYE